MKKPPYLCSRNQKTNKYNNKITKQYEKEYYRNQAQPY